MSEQQLQQAREYAYFQPQTGREEVEAYATPSGSETELEKDSPLAEKTSTGRQYAPIDGIDDQDRKELTRLATAISGRRPSTAHDAESLRRTKTLDLPDDDPSLDPASKSFDLYKWLRKTVHAFDQEGIQAKRAGIVFKDLNVSGSGAALQLQHTVPDIFLTPFRFREYFGKGSKQHKQILRNFDGVLKTGELLIVLGRPGSGCSTFLKSLCGELTGLSLKKGSVIHYNGEHTQAFGYRRVLMQL